MNVWQTSILDFIPLAEVYLPILQDLSRDRHSFCHVHSLVLERHWTFYPELCCCKKGGDGYPSPYLDRPQILVEAVVLPGKAVSSRERLVRPQGAVRGGRPLRVPLQAVAVEADCTKVFPVRTRAWQIPKINNIFHRRSFTRNEKNEWME